MMFYEGPGYYDWLGQKLNDLGDLQIYNEDMDEDSHNNFHAEMWTAYLKGRNNGKQLVYHITNERDFSKAFIFYVTVYKMEQVYGGPEEGGWWWDAFEMVDHLEINHHCDIEEAFKVLEKKYPQPEAEYTSTQSEGRYVFYEESVLGVHGTKRRPHYC